MDLPHPGGGESDGYSAAEVEVPEEHAHLGFAEACQRLQVDTRGTIPYLKLKAKP